MPAYARLSRIDCSKFGASASLAASVSLRDSLPASAGESERAVGLRLSTVNGPVNADFLLVLVGLVVEDLEVGVPLDRCVDLLAGHPLLDVGVIRDRLQA